MRPNLLRRVTLLQPDRQLQSGRSSRRVLLPSRHRGGTQGRPGRHLQEVNLQTGSLSTSYLSILKFVHFATVPVWFVQEPLDQTDAQVAEHKTWSVNWEPRRRWRSWLLHFHLRQPLPTKPMWPGEHKLKDRENYSNNQDAQCNVGTDRRGDPRPVCTCP